MGNSQTHAGRKDISHGGSLSQSISSKRMTAPRMRADFRIAIAALANIGRLDVANAILIFPEGAKRLLGSLRVHKDNIPPARQQRINKEVFDNERRFRHIRRSPSGNNRQMSSISAS